MDGPLSGNSENTSSAPVEMTTHFARNETAGYSRKQG